MATTAVEPQGPAAPDPLRHHKHYTEGEQTDSPYAGGSSFMERVAERVASGMGTVVELATRKPTNLVFSAVAFYTGALVIIAQKAQTRTDKANEEASARHRDELSQLHTQLLQQNTQLTQETHALAEKLSALTEEVHAATCSHG
jgi:uncharacterized membrane protein